VTVLVGRTEILKNLKERLFLNQGVFTVFRPGVHIDDFSRIGRPNVKKSINGHWIRGYLFPSYDAEQW